MRGKNCRMGTPQWAGGADEFACSDGGKIARYMVRWLGTRGEAGPPALDGPPRTKSAARSDEA